MDKIGVLIEIAFLVVGNTINESPETVKCKQRVERVEEIRCVGFWRKKTPLVKETVRSSAPREKRPGCWRNSSCDRSRRI